LAESVEIHHQKFPPVEIVYPRLLELPGVALGAAVQREKCSQLSQALLGCWEQGGRLRKI
jgi:hypothetical protein